MDMQEGTKKEFRRSSGAVIGIEFRIFVRGAGKQSHRVIKDNASISLAHTDVYFVAERSIY